MKRCDGERIVREDPNYFLIPHILPKRYDAQNMITVDIPVAPLKQYINEKRRENISISHIALILAAYLKAVERYPALNRFVVNKRIYQRNEFCVSMVVLRPGAASDTFSKIHLNIGDDIFTVQRKIDEYIEAGRQNTENPLDKIENVLLSMNSLLSVACNALRWADRHNILPKAIIDASPFHASLLISNLASIRTNHIYHHLYEFGTTSVGITMGNMREVPHTVKGEITLEKCIPLGVVMDERICSGHYFAQAFSYIKELLSDPHKMEAPALPNE